MTKEKRAELRERLDQLGAAWYDCPPEDSAVRQSLSSEIFQIAFELYCPKDPSRPSGKGFVETDRKKYSPEDAISEFYIQDFPRFDKSKGNFSSYLQERIKDRSRDNWNRDNGMRRLKKSVPDSGGEEKKSAWVDPFVHATEEHDPLETVPDYSLERVEEAADVDGTSWKLIAAMLELPQRLRGQANNPVRHNYFRLFFTDGITAFIRASDTPDVLHGQERELFRAMKEPFLDFFLARRCRSIVEIQCSGLKPYGRLVDGRPMDEEPKQPLPQDVYVSYLDREEGYRTQLSAVSQQKKAYVDFMRQCLD